MLRDSRSLALPLTRLRDTRIITSASRFTEKINELSNKFKNDSENYELFFRGHANIEWLLSPSVYRNNIIEKEHVNYQKITSTMPQEFSNLNSTFQKLVKMQHYDLPTRLLDITENPLVALYFACLSQKDDNDEEVKGEVIIFRVPENEVKYCNSDTVSILSNIAKMNNSFKFENIDDSDLDAFCSQSSVSSLLHEIRQEKNGFFPRINPEDFKKTVFVKPPLENQRLIRQEGAFILFGIDKEKRKPSLVPAQYIIEGDFQFIIEASSKAAILEELRLLGIHEAKLFPEMDRMSKHILSKCS